MGTTPVVAQTPAAAPAETMAPPAVKHTRTRHHLLHSGTTSASSRNVGPSSSVGGTSSGSVTGAQSGVPNVPGAPGAGPAGGGGGK